MAEAILTPTQPEPRDAVVSDDLLMEVVDLLTGWAALDADDYQLCSVRGCMVRCRVLEDGMCPRELWDERHELIAEIPAWLRR